MKVTQVCIAAIMTGLQKIIFGVSYCGMSFLWSLIKVSKLSEKLLDHTNNQTSNVIL
jgi:hypothetical protein